MACRIYVTDTLKAIAENTSYFAGGSAPTVRYADWIIGNHSEERTAREIADDVIKRAGLKVVEK